MSKWQLIIGTYYALPEADRTSRNVQSQLQEKGHFLRLGQVQDVLAATVLSEAISGNDVHVTQRTLKTLLNISLSDVRFHISESGEPDEADMAFAESLIRPLYTIGGWDASDMTQALAWLLAGYRACMRLDQQLTHIEQMNEFERRHKEDPGGQDLIF